MHAIIMLVKRQFKEKDCATINHIFHEAVEQTLSLSTRIKICKTRFLDHTTIVLSGVKAVCILTQICVDA